MTLTSGFPIRHKSAKPVTACCAAFGGHPHQSKKCYRHFFDSFSLKGEAFGGHLQFLQQNEPGWIRERLLPGEKLSAKLTDVGIRRRRHSGDLRSLPHRSEKRSLKFMTLAKRPVLLMLRGKARFGVRAPPWDPGGGRRWCRCSPGPRGRRPGRMGGGNPWTGRPWRRPPQPCR